MSRIGLPVSYRALEAHHTQTVIGKTDIPKRNDNNEPIPGAFEDQVVEGSVHHREAKEFAGQVTRVHDDGSCDLVIFPHQGRIVHIDRAKEGDGWGEFTHAAPPKPAKKATTEDTGNA